MSENKLYYTFRINDFTPETMPFGRLLEYYAQLKAMLGLEQHLHLVEVGEGSHATALVVDANHEEQFKAHVSALSAGRASAKASQASKRLNELLQADGTSASFYNANEEAVLEFPGSRTNEKHPLALQDTMSLSGELYYLAASGDKIALRLRTEVHGSVFGTTTKSIGWELRNLLFGPVKLQGHGEWLRHQDGTWSIRNFSVSSFTPLQAENLRQTVERIRSMDLEWPSDPLHELRTLEEKNGQVH